MGKILRFKNVPALGELVGLEVNGGKFVRGEGWFGKSGIVLHVPNVFRNPEIREQLEALCNDLIAKGLVHWVEDTTA